jgi:hypothetical protein
MRLTWPRPLTCPLCSARFERRQLRAWVCPHCRAEIGVAYSYRRSAGLLTLAWITVLGIATHNASSDGTWLLGIVLSGALFWLVFVAVVPPWLKKGSDQSRMTLGLIYLSVVASTFVVSFLGFTGMIMLLGNPGDLQEHLETMSMPLVWMSPNFLITRDKSFPDVCGVLVGNSFFMGLLLFACYQPIRWLRHRNRPTQLSITDQPSTDDDD